MVLSLLKLIFMVNFFFIQLALLYTIADYAIGYVSQWVDSNIGGQFSHAVAWFRYMWYYLRLDSVMAVWCTLAFTRMLLGFFRD